MTKQVPMTSSQNEYSSYNYSPLQKGTPNAKQIDLY